MGAFVSSLVMTGATINGVCYAVPFQISGGIAPLDEIPPERLGIRGEYDHNGLAKRVWLRFCEAVGAQAVAHLSVRQRGSVVILTGLVNSQALLENLIQLALQEQGATNVEVRGVEVMPDSTPGVQ